MKKTAKRMNPQCKTVLEHLIYAGSLSSVEAEAIYRIRRLAARISELRKWGIGINSDYRTDLTGQRYVRYQLVG